jgi:hypothetical protein
MATTFEDAMCFEDLVNCNLMFLRGELDETPLHLSPLMEESKLIVSDLINLCKDHDVLTTTSQPAITDKDGKMRQRGYITGCFQSNNPKGFVKRLALHTDLEYYVVKGNKKYMNISTDSDNRWHFTQKKEGSKWKTCTGLWMDSLVKDFDAEYDFYDTDYYNLLDDNVVLFCVCDPRFGLPANNCCSKLIDAMNY